MEFAVSFTQGESGFRVRARWTASRALDLSPCFWKALHSQIQVSSWEGFMDRDFWKLSMALATSPPNIFGAIRYWRPRLAHTRGFLSSKAMALLFSSPTLGPNFAPANIPP